jgi:hypothetical protein
VLWCNLVFDQVDLGVIPRCVDVCSFSYLLGWSMRPRNEYGHDHIVDVPPYVVMIKFIGHCETCGHVLPLRNPLVGLFSLLVYVIEFYFYVIMVLIKY